MVLKNKRIGVAMTGSFCTYTKAFEQIDRLLEEGAILQTIFSDISQHIKCRFGKGEEFVKRAHDMTGNEPMKTIEEAEIIGPTGCLDILILMPSIMEYLKMISVYAPMFLREFRRVME